MTRLPFEPSRTSTLTPPIAFAAATFYGWSVIPHENGGFFAQHGKYRMIVTFAPDNSFRHADVRKGFNGIGMELTEGDVIDTLARHGNPVGSEEGTT